MNRKLWMEDGEEAAEEANPGEEGGPVQGRLGALAVSPLTGRLTDKSPRRSVLKKPSDPPTPLAGKAGIGEQQPVVDVEGNPGAGYRTPDGITASGNAGTAGFPGP